MERSQPYKVSKGDKLYFIYRLSICCQRADNMEPDGRLIALYPNLTKLFDTKYVNIYVIAVYTGIRMTRS